MHICLTDLFDADVCKYIRAIDSVRKIVGIMYHARANFTYSTWPLSRGDFVLFCGFFWGGFAIN